MQHADTFLTGLLNRPYVHGWELRRAIAQLVDQLGGKVRAGLSLQWQDVGTAAISASGDLYLPPVKEDAKLSRAQFVRYVGYVIHEVCHWAYTDFSINGKNDYVRRLHNAIEDAWIERRCISERLTGNAERVLTSLVDQIVAEAIARVQDWSDPRQYPFILAVYCRRYGARTPMPEGLEPIFAQAEARIDAAQNSYDTLVIAEWVYDQLRALPQKSPERGQGKPGGQGQQQQGQQQGQQSEGQQGEGQSEGQTKGEGSSGKGNKATGSARRPTLDTKASEVEPTSGLTEEQKGMNITDPGTERDGYDVRHVPQREIKVQVPARLRYEVRRLFENTGYTAFTQGRRSGSINVGALHRAGFDDRVFQQRRDVEGIDSAVMIAIDCSGSMAGANINAACNTAYAMADALRSAEVPVGIVTFCSWASTALPIGAPIQRIRDICSRISAGGGTNDVGAVRLCMDTLLIRPEQRKVLFVITDGAGYMAQTRELCRAATALGITVIGIGIGERTVRHVYPQSVVLQNVEDLGSVCFKEIKVAA